MNNSEILMYQTEDEDIKIDVRFEDDTVWLTQGQMADLFQKNISTISRHINNIFDEGELEEKSNLRFMQIANSDKPVALYSLDVIISVGYRVKSLRGTQFRIWANKILKEYIIKGFVLNDEMLKNGRAFGKDYFDELLERIREIRASERRFYQKITDIYSQCSADYDPNSPITRQFYKTVQNKLHWAITGKTAAELVAARASAKKKNMGLTSWKNAPHGKIVRTDVCVAKNYLDESEIKELERIVSMYLDYAENQAERHIIMKMEDWIKKLDAFLQFNEYSILTNAGKVTHEVAKQLAEKEFEEFRIIQDKEYISDFDKKVKHIKNIN